jgi:hypothetical protein
MSIPLLYPEAMVFPSIFWKMETHGAIVGAIPSGLLVKSSIHGFDSMTNHSRCRLRDPGCATSTNPAYIGWLYDIQVNIVF